jgi:diacylglycerol kinase (ATP)
LVVNPSAGKGRALEMLPQVAGTLRDGGADLEILLSRDFAEAQSMTRRAIADGVDVLARDGRRRDDASRCQHLRHCSLAGRQPHHAGTDPRRDGNDLGRGIGLDPHDAVAAARVIAARYARSIDLARVRDTYVGAVLATGFDALVNRRANQMPWPRGSMRYALATMAELRVFSPLHYRLTLDGQVREQDAMLVAIGNTSSYGGGMLICPNADPYDGLLDVTIVHPVGRLKLLRLFPEMYSGKFVRDPSVEQLRVREVTVEGPGLVGFGDGEMIAAAPMPVCSVPHAVPVYVPHV